MQGADTDAIARNCHVQITYAHGPRSTVTAYVCSDQATLDLHGCTVAVAPAAGSWQHPSRSATGTQWVGAVSVRDSDGMSDKLPAAVRMTDCKFSIQLPDDARHVTVGRAVTASAGSSLAAKRCTFSGFVVDVCERSTCRLSDCIVDGKQGGDGGRCAWLCCGAPALD